MRTEARFPALPAKAGHYESFYIKAARPSGGRAIWIRHTIHKPPGTEPTASLWFTLFDADAAGPRTAKQTFSANELEAPPGAYVRVGGALLEPGTARGEIATEQARASWNLGFAEGAEPLHHLPYEFLYGAKLPKTKLLSPYPFTSFTGSVRAGDEVVEVDGWPGMVGHNWGAEHAERWIWMQAASLNGNDGDYIDVAAGRIKIGPAMTPWVANGRIVLDGEPHRLGGFRGSYGTELAETPSACEFTVAGRGVTVKGRVSAPVKDCVGWIYADPEGPEHNTVNCSIADMELRVERPGKRHAHIHVTGAAAYELGMRETDHGVPLQPYTDG